MLLIVDNYDSFVHNLARYFQQLGQETLVMRNDAVSVEQVKRLRPTAVVFSPGPGAPAEAGQSLAIVKSLHARVPMLGVCLGHQTLAEAFGGRIVRGNDPVHGRSSLVTHDGSGLFLGLPSPLRVGRYHSLVIDPQCVPAEFLVNARTDDGTIMAIEHRELPLYGVQFHPESILTEHGYAMLAGFLRQAGLATPPAIPAVEGYGNDGEPETRWPTMPVTF